MLTASDIMLAVSGIMVLPQVERPWRARRHVSAVDGWLKLPSVISDGALGRRTEDVPGERFGMPGYNLDATLEREPRQHLLLTLGRNLILLDSRLKLAALLVFA